MLATLAVPPAAEWMIAIQTIVLLLLIFHVLEIAIAFKHIQRYPANLVDSIALTVLFGFRWP